MTPSIAMLVVHLFVVDSALVMVTKAQSIMSDGFAFSFDFILLQFCFFAYVFRYGFFTYFDVMIMFVCYFTYL